MNNPSIVLLLSNFSSLSERKRSEFMGAVDRISPMDTIALIDSDSVPGCMNLSNIKLVKFSHGKDIGDTIRAGLASAVKLGAENIVTFDDYSIENAAWFLSYIGSGNVIESSRRGMVTMLATEVSNILSFGSMYNGFSMNRIFTKEAAIALKGTKLEGKAFPIEATNVLNRMGIKTVEVVKPVKAGEKQIKPKEIFDSIVHSINHSSKLFGAFSSIAYVFNLLAVYLSLSLGWFYPLAILVGGEISAFSNFIMNEKVNFRNRGLSKSAYRFGKFNAIALIPIIADIVLIGYLAKYTSVIGKELFVDLSIVTMVFMSVVSLYLVTKFIWSKGNNMTIKI